MNLSEEVRSIMRACLYSPEEVTDGKPPEGAIIVEGVMHKFGLDPKRVEKQRSRIRYVLDQMPDNFHRTRGGGWSFLNLCVDKEENQWGEHPVMDDLVCLGLATNMAGFCMPRDSWHMLPGGVPYVWINTIDKQIGIG